jgi:hypothetical protein
MIATPVPEIFVGYFIVFIAISMEHPLRAIL